MDYIKQLNAFWHWRELHDISHTQADIYMALLDIFNRRFWETEIAVPNRTIIAKANITDTKRLVTERAALVGLGLIKYTAGKHKKAGTYSVIPLYDTEGRHPNYPQNTTKDATQNTTQNAPQNTTINKTKNIKHKTKTKTDIYTSDDASDSAEIQAIFDAYNEICKSLPKAEKLDTKRKNAIRARLKQFGAQEITAAFTRAEQSDFMKGITGNWRANLDWFMKNDSNIRKVNEGNYDNNTNPKNTTQSTTQNTTQHTTQNTPYELGVTEDIDAIEKQFMAALERDQKEDSDDI